MNFSAASKLFDEMQIEFPSSKFVDKVIAAIFADRLTNSEKKDNYYKALREMKEKYEKLKIIRAQRMKEFKQEIEQRKQILIADIKHNDEEFNNFMAIITRNLKIIANQE